MRLRPRAHRRPLVRSKIPLHLGDSRSKKRPHSTSLLELKRLGPPSEVRPREHVLRSALPWARSTEAFYGGPSPPTTLDSPRQVAKKRLVPNGTMGDGTARPSSFLRGLPEERAYTISRIISGSIGWR
jgi:hypothetical protein